MESHLQISAESAWLHRLFSPGPTRVSLTGGTIYFEKRPGDVRARIPVGTIGSITVRPSWFWHRLTIRLADGSEQNAEGVHGLNICNLVNRAVNFINRISLGPIVPQPFG